VRRRNRSPNWALRSVPGLILWGDVLYTPLAPLERILQSGSERHQPPHPPGQVPDVTLTLTNLPVVAFVTSSSSLRGREITEPPDARAQ